MTLTFCMAGTKFFAGIDITHIKDFTYNEVIGYYDTYYPDKSCVSSPILTPDYNYLKGSLVGRSTRGLPMFLDLGFKLGSKHISLYIYKALKDPTPQFKPIIHPWTEDQLVQCDKGSSPYFDGFVNLASDTDPNHWSEEEKNAVGDYVKYYRKTYNK